MSDAEQTHLMAVVGTLRGDPALIVRQSSDFVSVWPVENSKRSIEVLEVVCDRINGVGTPAAALLDLTPKPSEPTWGKIAGWVLLGFWFGVLAVYVAQKVVT
ncbi:MAG: hypothetical protein ACK5U4_16410 [Rhodospirillales bacterium]